MRLAFTVAGSRRARTVHPLTQMFRPAPTNGTAYGIRQLVLNFNRSFLPSISRHTDTRNICDIICMKIFTLPSQF